MSHAIKADYGVVQFHVHVLEFRATMLHVWGIGESRPTYRQVGRDFRLKGIHGNVVAKALA